MGGAEDLFDDEEVGFGVYADGVGFDGFDVDVDAVFEPAELFETLDDFQLAGGQGRELLQGGAAVGVEADVLPVAGVAGGVAVKWNGGAGEVKRATIGGGDDFDGVGVVDVLRRAGGFDGGDLDVFALEGEQQGGDVGGLQEGFVALDVDVDVGGEVLRDGVEAVGAGLEIGRGEAEGPGFGGAEGGDFIGVGGDDDLVELRTGAGGIDYPSEEGAAGELAQDFAGEAGGGQTRRDDGGYTLRFVRDGRHRRYGGGDWNRTNDLRVMSPSL